MPETKHLVLILNLVAALIVSAWNLGGEETHPAPQSAVKRAARVPQPATNQLSHAARLSPISGATATNKAVTLPPAPPDVTDLKFSELFKPIGPRGLEYSDKLRALEGKKVRILGYMVNQSQLMPWTFLLSAIPVTLHEEEYGLAEDMPATIVHVITQKNATPIVPHTPGLLLLTGTLGLGNRQEADGRISSVRLTLDPPTPEQRAALNPLARSQTSNSSLSTNAMPK